MRAWGSLYDALYGTDVIAEENGAERLAGYNALRGKQVMAYAAQFLDQAAPLEVGQHSEVIGFTLNTDALANHLCTAKDSNAQRVGLNVELADGTLTSLADTRQFVGYAETDGMLSSVLLCNNGLHLDIQIDPNDVVGRAHRAAIKDVIVESALTTIED
ncbi:MAG: malate synthase, partial [Gammaproteobacteria bacterium]